MTPLFHVLRCCLWLIVLSDGTREIPLKSDSSLRFVNFKEYKFRYLEVSKPIKTQRVRQIFECGMECLEHSDCISLNVAAFPDQEGRFWCELLLADMINNSECLGQNASSHHFAKWSPCLEKPCENGGSCVANYNDDTFNCVCKPGFEGNNCQLDIDDCVPNPCTNGGSCSDGISDYTCSCADGFDGKNCTIDIDECVPNPCENSGSCSDGISDYTCSCADGFEGKNCTIDVDDCASNPCQNGGTCVDAINNYTCTCANGFVGKNCRCNIGWTLFNNSCYKFFQDKLTWSAAQTECEAFESLLVTIHSREENNFVWSLIPSGNFDIWMGGSDVAFEGSWVWKDGQAWGLFASWKTGEPNNLGNEDCLLMYDESGNWNDLSCTATRAYVCVKLHGIIAASQ